MHSITTLIHLLYIHIPGPLYNEIEMLAKQQILYLFVSLKNLYYI